MLVSSTVITLKSHESRSIEICKECIFKNRLRVDYNINSVFWLLDNLIWGWCRIKVLLKQLSQLFIHFGQNTLEYHHPKLLFWEFVYHLLWNIIISDAHIVQASRQLKHSCEESGRESEGGQPEYLRCSCCDGPILELFHTSHQVSRPRC